MAPSKRPARRARQVSLADDLRFLSVLVERSILARQSGLTFGGKRNVSEALGYAEKLAANDYPFQLLIHEIVRSLPFQQRRGEAPKTESAPKAKQVAQR